MGSGELAGDLVMDTIAAPNMKLDQITAEALSLPPDLRARLVEQLVESLAEASTGDLQELWVKEAMRRRDELRSGAVRAIDGSEVAAEVRRVVGGI
jgi:putative addiction module component (TIGR02574 family)